MGISPWTATAGYAASPEIFTLDQALAIEANPPAEVSGDPSMADQGTAPYGPTPFTDIDWPLGSPSNYALAIALQITLDQGDGDTELVNITDSRGAQNDGNLQNIYGNAWRDFTNDHDAYVYEMRGTNGRPHLVHEADVLAAIGRTFGQRGR